MFVDRVKIFVKAGDGGRGCVSFRREPYVPMGGPDGGVGGRGGDIDLVAVSHQNTLLPLRYHTEFRADRGEHGGPGNRTGAEGEDLLIAVPPGTMATDEQTGEPLGEVLKEGDRLRVAKGGRGGRGNRSFLSNRNNAPREAEPGETGRGALAAPRPEAHRRGGAAGVPQRGQIDAAGRDLRRAAEDRGLPVHHAQPGAGRGRGRRADVRDRRHPRHHRGRQRGRGPRACSSSATWSARACSCTWWTPPGSPAATRWPTCARSARRSGAGRPALLDRPQLLVASKRDAVAEQDPLPALSRRRRARDPRLPVSAVTGAGLLELKRALLAAVRAAREVEPVPAEPS